MKEKILKVFNDELKNINSIPKMSGPDYLNLHRNTREEQTLKLLGLVKQALDLPEHEGHEYQPTYEH